MKRICFAVGLSLSTIGIYPQSCNSFYYFQRDRVFEKTVYDAKNKVTAVQEYRLLDLHEQDGKITALVQAETAKNGKDPEYVTGLYICDGTGLRISMGKTPNGQEAFVDYPNNPKSDQGLATGIEFETETKIAGKAVKVNCIIGNRKILSDNETVTTSLGSWHCIKTGYDLELRSKIIGIGISVNVYVTEWFSPGLGIVRTDVYRGDKLMERRLLTGTKNSGYQKQSVKHFSTPENVNRVGAGFVVDKRYSVNFDAGGRVFYKALFQPFN